MIFGAKHADPKCHFQTFRFVVGFWGSCGQLNRMRNARLLARRGVLAAPSAYLGEAEDRVAEEIEAEPPWPNQLWPAGYQGEGERIVQK